jgi:hypothetical protein
MKTQSINKSEDVAAKHWHRAIKRLENLRTLIVWLAAVVTMCAFVFVFNPTFCPSPISPASFVFAAVMLWTPAWGADSSLKKLKSLHDSYSKPAA